MKRNHPTQYTIRGVPPRVDEALRRRSRQQHCSLNQVALEALTIVAGQTEQRVRYRDLDFMIGTWVNDPEFDAVIQEQDRVDPDLWR